MNWLARGNLPSQRRSSARTRARKAWKPCLESTEKPARSNKWTPRVTDVAQAIRRLLEALAEVVHDLVLPCRCRRSSRLMPSETTCVAYESPMLRCGTNPRSLGIDGSTPQDQLYLSVHSDNGFA